MNRLVGCTGFTVTIAVAAACCGTGRAATSLTTEPAGGRETAVWPRAAGAAGAGWAGDATTGAAGLAAGCSTTLPLDLPEVAVTVCAGGSVADGGGRAATVVVEDRAPGGGGSESLAIEPRGTAAATCVSVV